MTTRNKSIVFLAITFAFSWAIAIGAWALGMAAAPGFVAPILTLMMAGPAVAAVVCAFWFEPKDARAKALGLRWTPNVWWLAAWLGVLALALLSVLFTALLSGREVVDIGAQVRATAADQGVDVAAAPAWATSTMFLVGAAAIIGAAVNTLILTFTEELGWRGYLHHLWRGGGFWRASLATGAVWGVWHAPAILLYGLNYPEHREIGVAIFVVFCMLLSPLLTFVRDRGGSVVAAGVAHGTINAMGGLTLLALSDPSFPWSGLVGGGGFAALVLGVGLVALLRRGDT